MRVPWNFPFFLKNLRQKNQIEELSRTFLVPDAIREFQITDASLSVVEIHQDAPAHGAARLELEWTDRPRREGDLVNGPVREPFDG